MKPKPARLGRVNPAESIFQQDIIIRISVITVILFSMLIFIGLCFLFKGPTYGYL
ncbi:hypothetical protein [Methanobrevibacter olleyae]|uniref:hypothetical protein n=1 Tax=Methanobrevibacter olleyae TaxID=294671 RepID=UPI000AA1C485|nr:hypothetical protein [Methanobrevibacter olleyae]